jgi:hypothetical protein
MRKCLIYFIAISLLQTAVWADVTVVQSFTLDNLLEKGHFEAQRVLQIRGSLSRKETTVRLKGRMPKTWARPKQDVTLVSLDKGVVQKLDLRKKVYEEVPLSGWRNYWETQWKKVATPSSVDLRIVEAWSRTLSTRQHQIVNGYRCRKMIYELHLGVFNADTQARKDYTIQTTLWLADPTLEIKKPLDEENTYLGEYRRKLGGAAPDDLNRFGLAYASQVTSLDEQTLSSALAKAMSYMKGIKGYLVSSETEWFAQGFRTPKPLFVVRSEVESFSQDPLPSSVFSVSSKFKPAKKAEPTVRVNS